MMLWCGVGALSDRNLSYKSMKGRGCDASLWRGRRVLIAAIRISGKGTAELRLVIPSPQNRITHSPYDFRIAIK